MTETRRTKFHELELTHGASVMVPLDGSPLGERAVEYATCLACSSGASLLLVSVVRPHSERAAAEEMQQYLDVIAWRIETAHSEVSVRTKVLIDAFVAPAILAEVARQSVAVVVVATHRRGRTGRWRHGTVTEPLLTQLGVPLLVIPEDAPDAWRADRALKLHLLLDGSPCSEAGLLPAAAVAGWLGAELTLVDVVEPAVGGRLVCNPADQMARERAYLEGIVRVLQAIGMDARICVELGRAAPTISRLARTARADLIAMSLHGWGGSSWMVPGSVATGLLETMAIPLLFVGGRDRQQG